MNSQKWTKSDSFTVHYEQHFKYTTPCNDLCKFMAFKVVKQINPIEAMKSFTKLNCKLCMEERLTNLKKLRDKTSQLLKKSEIYRACRHKMTFYRFCLSTDDPTIG